MEVDWNRVKAQDDAYLNELVRAGYNISNWKIFWDAFWKKHSEGHNYNELHPRIIETLRFLNPSILIDIGCGPGNLVEKIRNNFPQLEIWGMDISEFAIELSRQRCNGIKGLVGKFPEDANIITGIFDVIILCEFLEHIDDDNKAMGTTRRFLKENGSLLVSVPDNRLAPFQEKTHVRMYNEETLKNLLTQYYNKVEIQHLPADEKLYAICKEAKK